MRDERQKLAGLAEILNRCRELCAASDDAMFSSTTVSEIASVLDRAIDAIAAGVEPDRSQLKLLFAPTGAIQEISMANGWHSEYIELSTRFDDLIAG